MTTPTSHGAGQPLPGPNLVGRQLGRYEIVSFIASGGMASVYVARALGMAGFERMVAIKVLHPHLAHEHDFIGMFLDEARLAARIRHPNVVATLDISSTEAEGFYLVMEYVEGDHLGRLLAGAARAGTRLPVPVVLRIISDALQGLGAAHDLDDADGRPLQLVHRDVSPHNLLVGMDGVARLTDFGVARAEVRLAATRDGQFKGKLGYMSPEQISAGACDRRSDLFAMGVVLWEALAGRRLFRADDTVGMLRAVLQQPIPLLATERPELAPLDELLSMALARKPEMRFQRASGFLDALEAVAPQVGGIAAPRQVTEAVRQFAPPRVAPQNRPLVPGSPGQTAFQTHLITHGGSMPGWPLRPGSGTYPGQPPRYESGSFPGEARQPGGGALPGQPQQHGSGSFPGQGYPPGSGSFPGQGYPPGSGTWPGTPPPPPPNATGVWPRQPGTGLWPQQPPPPRKRTALLVGGLAAAAIAVAALFLLLPRGAPEAAPAPEAPARVVSAPIDAALLTGTGDTVPRLVEGDPPLAPEGTSLALTPTIVLRLHVGVDGAVVESRVYRSRLDLQVFEEAALEAVKSYRFAPAQKAGTPVPAWFNLPLTFTRPKTPTTLLQLRGSDTIGGSLAPALGRAFRTRHPEVGVQVEALGSSTAFTGLFDGSADIGAASRPVNEKELAEARRQGINLQEFVIGYDGIAVVVHPRNGIRNLTVDQLSRIFTGQLANWRDIGGSDAPIRLIGRPASSGTHAFFKERVLRLGDSRRTEEFAKDVELLEHNDEIIAAVAADPHAISYVGLGAVESNVRVVPVAPSPGKMAVYPGVASVADGSYPIYRPLLLYTRGMPTGEVARFVRFVLSRDGRRIVEDQGFVPSEAAAETLALDE